MDSLNDLYQGYNEQKKVDPLDKLFYQYNFTSGNHMRMNANVNSINHGNSFNQQQQMQFYNNQPVYNNHYGMNSQLKY